MKTLNRDNGLLRIGVFYDGNYFSHVSNYYLYEHERKARLSITGLHAFIRDEVARHEGADKRFCQIVDAHYFRGRLSAKAAERNDSLYRERQFDDVLIREGVTMHFMPVTGDRVGNFAEKGIDVWFALEAFELAVHKRFDVSVLVTGDGDFVPLVRKLNTLGTRVMLLAWDFDYQRDGEPQATRTAQSLINEVTYPVMMSDEIDSRGRKKDAAIASLFVQKSAAQQDAPRPAHTSATANETDLTAVRNGTIATYHPDRGFGFIRPATGGENVYFHVSSLLETWESDLSPTRPLTYTLKPSDRGGMNAINVKVQST